MTDIERMAAGLAFDDGLYWHELNIQNQADYKTKAVNIVAKVEDNILNGNWTKAITTVVHTSNFKLSTLGLYHGDMLSLADYVIAELKSRI